MEDQARAALRPLLTLAVNPPSLEPLFTTSGDCPNCGGVAPSNRTPYCSDCCKSVSAFVRQFRVALAAGGPNDERLMMFGQTFWFLIGGGRPLRVSITPNSAVKQVFKRTEGKCEECGAPATTIDNVGSG
jgi:hypothetical protein